MLEKYEDISSPECITEYYDKIYSFKDDIIRRRSIAKDVTKPQSLPFADYARDFRMIDSNTVSVAVECDEESMLLISQLIATGFTNYRKLQKYTFTVYEYELKKLIETGTVKQYGDVWCLVNNDQYSSDKGISFEAHDIYI